MSEALIADLFSTKDNDLVLIAQSKKGAWWLSTKQCRVERNWRFATAYAPMMDGCTEHLGCYNIDPTATEAIERLLRDVAYSLFNKNGTQLKVGRASHAVRDTGINGMLVAKNIAFMLEPDGVVFRYISTTGAEDGDWVTHTRSPLFDVRAEVLLHYRKALLGHFRRATGCYF